MAKKINKRYPVYFEDFKCIGGKCEDSCCIGWNIDIDKVTFSSGDSFLKGLGKEMVKFIKETPIETVKPTSCLTFSLI